MRVIADLCIVPIGVGVSLSKYVAACEAVIKESGLKAQLHAYGTNVEGDWDLVMAVLKRCHEAVHELGAPRITTTVKLGTRVDRTQTMEDKVKSVEEKLGKACE
ncbi:MAG: MTH1187 family thiamine-binding protein [Acidobacteriota bacterium]|nr:MAG: MTH1187 family thiamine-binding protein [Acidobacteriota bacterium]